MADCEVCGALLSPGGHCGPCNRVKRQQAAFADFYLKRELAKFRYELDGDIHSQLGMLDEHPDEAR